MTVADPGRSMNFGLSGFDAGGILDMGSEPFPPRQIGFWSPQEGPGSFGGGIPAGGHHASGAVPVEFTHRGTPVEAARAGHMDALVHAFTPGSHHGSQVDWSSNAGLHMKMTSGRDDNTAAQTSPVENGSQSSSYPLFHSRLNLSGVSTDGFDEQYPKPLDAKDDEAHDLLDPDAEERTIGKLLPEDDELVDPVMEKEARDLAAELDDMDLFSSGGGLELDGDNDGLGTRKIEYLAGINSSVIGNSGGPAEHPFGEHPSRTLFVRNINSNVDDAELRALFEQYGAIRTLYTACKHRGFVMISYYDIRAARNAMRALQNKSLRRRKLDIHYSIPKENPSDKDINQGTLVVFNLDASVTNDDLRRIFGVYGEVKEVRETPHKKHHKFIEFYDVRAAESALRALNRSDIAGKRIKLEPSRPGGARRSLMQQLSAELAEEENRPRRQLASSPLPASPPLPASVDAFSSRMLGASPFSYASVASGTPPMHQHMSNGASSASLFSNGLTTQQYPQSHLPPPLPPQLSSQHQHRTQALPVNLPPRAAPRPSSSYGQTHSLPDDLLGLFYESPVPVSNGGHTANHYGNITNSGNLRHYSLSASVTPSGSPYDRAAGSGNRPTAFNAAPGAPTSHNLANGSQLWDRPSYNPLQSVWQPSPPSQLQYQSQSPSHSGVQSSMYNGALARSSSFEPAPGPISRPMQVPGSMGSQGVWRASFGNPEYSSLPAAAAGMSPGYDAAPGSYAAMARGFQPSPSSNCVNGYTASDLPNGGLRRQNSGGVDDRSKQQYALDLDKILNGHDMRTTLMIKNIPNKYTQKMLLAAIDELHRGTYDFFYLPIDFKNKCNVGYAFINMTHPSKIVSFYQTFNGKKWDKFNSEKVASLAYARIQGKSALVAHFQNSSLMNEDKRCRPILFSNVGDQEPFPVGGAAARSRPVRTPSTGSPNNGGFVGMNSSGPSSFGSGSFLTGLGGKDEDLQLGSLTGFNSYGFTGMSQFDGSLPAGSSTGSSGLGPISRPASGQRQL
eukprot:jgi/Chlat1/5290/Chrsp35S05248